MPTSLAVRSLAALVGAAALFAVQPAFAEEKPSMRTVTVTASGHATAVPDMANVSSGVVSEAKTAREALTRNSAAMAKLIAGLKTAGIAAEDIQTTSFNVNPVYTNPPEGRAAEISGYQVHNQVSVRARNLDKLGEVLDSLVTLGSNQMNGMSFEVSKAETLKDEARKEAIANARRRAELFAAAAGASVGEVVSISEDTAEFHPRPMAYRAAVQADSVPVERGTETLEARVTVTWALK